MSLFSNLIKTVEHKIGFWGNLVRNNTGVSALNWFLVMSTLTGLALLVVVMFCMIWEVVHNNSITSDISGWATFVAAVGTFLAPAGIAKGWTNWSENKFKNSLNETQISETTTDTSN